MSGTRFLRRAILPASVFLAVWCGHFACASIFPEIDPAQARWATAPQPARPPLARYVEGAAAGESPCCHGGTPCARPADPGTPG